MALFQSLRTKGGLSIGISEYKALLDALNGGIGLESFQDQMHLCTLLWAKNREQITIVENYFNDYVAAGLSKIEESNLVNLEEKPDPKIAELTNNDTANEEDLEPEGQQNTNPTNDPLDAQNQGKTETSQPISTPSQSFTPERVSFYSDSNRQDIGLAKEPFFEFGNATKYFNLQERCIDATEREMVQAWRKLRLNTRFGTLSEIDLDATIEEISKKGAFYHVIRRALQINVIKLHILIDRDGSMTPFHPVSEQIVQAIKRWGGFQSIETVYFHDVPSEYLYRTSRLNQPMNFFAWLGGLDLRNSHVIVISDAGSARGEYSERRIKQSLDIFGKIKSKCKRLSILNPMPCKRWAGSSAEPLSKVFPFFEITGSGIRGLADYLRGYSSWSQKGGQE